MTFLWPSSVALVKDRIVVSQSELGQRGAMYREGVIYQTLASGEVSLCLISSIYRSIQILTNGIAINCFVVMTTGGKGTVKKIVVN